MYLEDQANIIFDYINDSRYSQAVMVNGAWGVGKTYFVDNFLLKKLTNYTVVRYSLYGVQSTDQVKSDLQRLILLKLIENKEFVIKGKSVSIPSKLVDLAPNAARIIWKKIGLETDDLGDLIEKIELDKSKILIVFDDLERSGMEINEVLGLINSYVECQIKVVIIANENEIGSARLSMDLPQKFLVASNTSISLKEKEGGADTDNKSSSTEKVYNYSDLIERTHKLFSNDITYNSIKEKLVGLTVTIYASYHQLYDKLVCYYAPSASTVLLKYKDSIIELFLNMNCQNLRTFIFAVITFDKIYEAIMPVKSKYNKSQYCDLYNEEILSILKSVMFFSIKYKSGEHINTNNDYYSRLYYSGIIIGIKEYSFVNKYISMHELDTESIVKDINTFIKSEIARQEKNDEKNRLSYFKLNSFGWLEYNDNTVISLSNQLYNELEAEKYDVAFFKYIVIYLIQLENYFSSKRDKIIHSDDEYIELMEQYIQKHATVENQLELLEIISDDKAFRDNYNTKISKLVTATKEKEKTSSNIELMSIFNSENWAETFYIYCRDNYDSFMNSRRFLSLFDMIILKKHLLNASNTEIQRFSQAICLVYDFSNIRDFYNMDSTNLEIIINVLDERYSDENTDCTTKFVISTNKRKLETKLKMLK